MNINKLFSKKEIQLFLDDSLDNAYDIFGAHFCEFNGKKGCRFAVWSPRAKSVFLVGDFSNWKPVEMQQLWDTGVYAAFVEGVYEFAHYKYFITAQNGQILEKADPYAFYAQQPPNNASRVISLDYDWKDGNYRRRKIRNTFLEKPMSIYEMHMGSWRRDEDNAVYKYSEVVDPLLDYVIEMGFTHIEIMPITEYPLEDSWGYQTTGYFAPTSKYGTPQDFMYFVDRCHQRGIGVILDWVPSHFPKDAFALAQFDGEPLYEYADKRVGEHYQWGTLVFDYGKKEVVNFLVSSALFWVKYYHIDGFRVDAVTSMIHLDYMRSDYITNIHGGNENLEAIDFLCRLNRTMNEEFPEVLMIAEEATSWQGVTKPLDEGGLGFDLKWNMGWMNDMLRYMQREPHHRKFHHNELTFSLMYAFNENYILPFSHDEVVHSELSMVNKMPGDYWQKFANLRLLYAFMYTHPGKKLLFMGNEFAQFIEWKYYVELEWFMIEYELHGKMQTFVKELNHIYQQKEALWQVETSWDGFDWINPNNAEESIISFARYNKTKSKCIVVVCNFTPQTKEDFRIGLPQKGNYVEILNTDNESFGGSGVTNEVVFKSQAIPWDNLEHSLAMRLPPLSCVIFEKVANTRRVDMDVRKKK